MSRKKSLMLIVVAIAVLVCAVLGYKYWKARKFALPDGIVSGNGRLEAKLVDVTAKEPLRVKEVLVDEGDVVQGGQTLVRLDTVTLDAQRVEAEANVAAAKERLAVAQAAIIRRQSEIALAKIEVERTSNLVKERAASQRELDVRKTSLEVAQAALAEEEAKLQTAKVEVEVAQANVEVIQTRINDATLTSPVHGRVLYRLAEVGEVLGPGGKALTLVNLNDVYMEIFLPSEDAARVKIGADARLTVDYAPGRSVPGFVSFVSPEAQFTPKQVETRTEREKLMFRIKIQVPEEYVSSYAERVKTGVRGVGYVKIADSAAWPEWLQNLLAPPEESAGSQAAPSAPVPGQTAPRAQSTAPAPTPGPAPAPNPSQGQPPRQGGSSNTPVLLNT